MSERKSKTYRLPEDLCKILEEEVKKRGPNFSENDLVNDALRHWFQCDRLEPQGQMRLIVLKYPAKCLKHPDEVIPAGSWALYGKGIGAICMDAYIERLGDKGIIAKFLKVRELEQTKKALLKECDRLADKFELLTLSDKWDQLLTGSIDLRKAVKDFLTRQLGTNEETKGLEDFLSLEQKIQEIARQVEQWLEKQYAIKRKPLTKASHEV